jgi:hypothetical protein
MARKTAKAPEPEAVGRKPTVVQIRGSEEYKAWVEAVAKKEGFPVSVLFDQALRKFAEGKHGLPPER